MSEEDYLPPGATAYSGPPLRGDDFRDEVWVTKDQKKIVICEMEDRHLFNAWRRSGDERLFKEMVVRLFEQQIIQA